jgi:drug/metabolite transporter (DMT)-like permease
MEQAMSTIDIVTLSLGTLLALVGAIQVATGTNFIGRFGRKQVAPPGFYRAVGAMFLFLGLFFVLNAFQGPFGHTGHGLLAIGLATGVLVSATWALVQYAQSRAPGGNRK